MKVAYICEPQIGGTFTFYRRIRPELARLGIDFRCIPPVSAEHILASPFKDIEGLDPVSFPEADLARSTALVVEHLQRGNYDVAMILPGSGIFGANIVRFTPRSIRTMARVPMFTRGAYAPAKALSGSLDAMACVCDRIADDLSGHYGINRDILTVIYNGVDVPDQLPPRRIRQSGDPLRLVFTGRLVDSHKGIFCFPELVKGLVGHGVDAHMEIIGTGPDEAELIKRVDRARLSGRFRFSGALDLTKLHTRLQQADIYVMPSLYEGCPNGLLEAMAVGCTCVVSRLAGSTDRIIEDGTSGLLAEVGVVSSFVDQCLAMAREPERSAAVGQAAWARVCEHFTVEKTAQAYAGLFQKVLASGDRREPARSADKYDIPSALRPSWRTWIPDPLKNIARMWLERMGRSS